MKTTLKLFTLLILAGALVGCETVLKVAEYAFYPAEWLIRPMSRMMVKTCHGSTNPWEGTAGSPCPAASPMQKYSVEVSYGPAIKSTCTPDIFPAMTYAEHCTKCHDRGTAPDLRASGKVARATYGELAHFIQDGDTIHGMPSFAGRLTTCQIDGVAQYIKTTASNRKAGEQ
jgi:hypothetical protein